MVYSVRYQFGNWGDISFSVVRFMLSVALFKAASVNHIDAVGVSSITAKIWAIIIII